MKPQTDYCIICGRHIGQQHSTTCKKMGMIMADDCMKEVVTLPSSEEIVLKESIPKMVSPVFPIYDPEDHGTIVIDAKEPHAMRGTPAKIDEYLHHPSEDSKSGGSTPSQYSFPVYCIELQDLIEYRNMNFAVGNIFKACYRLNNCSHSDAGSNLRKMIWFAERELARLKES